MQNNLRNRLIEITSAGLSLVSISRVTNIGRIDLNRFKNGQIGLIEADAEKLERFLQTVHIPTSI